MSQYQTIEISREGHLTCLALDRPDALNALSTRLVDELRDFLAGLPEDTETRVVVVRGKGRAFCAGLDLKEDRSASNSDADRALATGLVSRVVPDAELESAARELAGRMLCNSPLALRLTKECLKVTIDAGSLEAAIAIEDRNQILASSSSDFREGVAAFLEKREPKFQDR